MEADIAARPPLAEIAERNTGFLHSSDDCLLTALTRLRDAGIRPFAGLPD